MNETELKEYFEKEFLSGTCFETLGDLMVDKTSININAVRAMIAIELKGVWRGLTKLNKKIINDN